MPELPEVETVMRGLAPHMEGRDVLCVELFRANLRFPFPDMFAQRLEGRRIVALARRAKYVLVHMDNASVLVMHLGMSGSFRIEDGQSTDTPGIFHHERGADGKHDHVVLHLSGGTRIIYNDPRRFGYMDLLDGGVLEESKHFAKMGVEPLGNALSGALLYDLYKGKKTSLKAALLDQRLVAGLGNIYVCEALWRAHISPLRAAGHLSLKECVCLADEIGAVLRDAIAAGGSSLRDYKQADGSLGYFQHTFGVYDQENMPCKHDACDGVIERIQQSGRSTFYCASCQK